MLIETVVVHRDVTEKAIKAARFSGGFSMAHYMKEVFDDSFEAEVLESEVPTLVEFRAPWSEPSKTYAPILEDIAQQFSGQIQVAHINAEDNRQSLSDYKVRGFPKFVLFKSGEVVEDITGAVPKERLVSAIARMIP